MTNEYEKLRERMYRQKCEARHASEQARLRAESAVISWIFVVTVFGIAIWLIVQ
jgi:hypothetical protein